MVDYDMSTNEGIIKAAKDYSMWSCIQAYFNTKDKKHLVKLKEVMQNKGIKELTESLSNPPKIQPITNSIKNTIKSTGEIKNDFKTHTSSYVRSKNVKLF